MGECVNFGIIDTVERNCGERRYVSVKVSLNNRLFPVVIERQTAKWEMFNDRSVRIMRGGCEVVKNTVRVLLPTHCPGTYDLKFTFRVPPETIIAGVRVRVR